MDNEQTIPNHYVQGFVANLSLVPQQTESRLVSCVTADLGYTGAGKMFNADDIGDDDDEQEVNTRAPDSPESFSEHQRRVGFFKAYQKGRFVDNLDVVRMLQDPTNTVMAGMMATKRRATDDRIIAAFNADVREGENGENTVAFPSSQIIAASNRDFLHDAEVVPGSGALPLTVGKLIKARTMLDASEVEGQSFFGATAHQLGNLLSSTPATSSDYNTIKALAGGETNSFMGFTFVRTERLKIVAANVRGCFAWKKTAMIYKERPIQNAWIKPRLDKSGRLYAYYEVERGAVRHYDKGVIQVNCAEDVF